LENQEIGKPGTRKLENQETRKLENQEPENWKTRKLENQEPGNWKTIVQAYGLWVMLNAQAYQAYG